MIIADNITTGSSEDFKYVYGTKPLNLYVEGDFGDASVALEAKSPSGDYIPVSDGDIPSPGLYVIESFPATYRVTITGEAVSLSAHVVGQSVV